VLLIKDVYPGAQIWNPRTNQKGGENKLFVLPIAKIPQKLKEKKISQVRKGFESINKEFKFL
jgi:hypothetical protein